MAADERDSPLRLGPMLRYADENSVSIWVQTHQAATVSVHADGREWSARTFTAHGFHYALVLVTGLAPASRLPYTVAIDGAEVWPPPASTFPPSVIRTIDPARPTRLAFGSCRTTAGHDPDAVAMHGIDALRSYGMALARDRAAVHWPDVLLFLGDQVYADEVVNPEMLAVIHARRAPGEEPQDEIRDYVEYDHLYQLAWLDPVVRWLLSTIPSAMIFDDHDVRDDWNTSYAWRHEITQLPWWQLRIESALASYWVYQHAGNLAPRDLAADEIWRRVQAAKDGGEVDITAALDALADRADEHPETYRWSYTRDLGDSLLIVLDSRAARELQPERRSMLDERELAWLDDQLRGGCDHVFIGTSLPFLLPPGLHDLEAVDEQLANGSFGPRLARLGEKLRQAVDLEHWAAFTSGFDDVFAMVIDLARGGRGPAPATITFLSGDVHNSYLAEVTEPGRYAAQSRIIQAVASPMRNPMPRWLRIAISLVAKRLVRPMRFLANRSARIGDPKYPWTVTHGPWFDNNVAVCEVCGRGLRLSWWAGTADDGLRSVADITLS